MSKTTRMLKGKTIVRASHDGGSLVIQLDNGKILVVHPGASSDGFEYGPPKLVFEHTNKRARARDLRDRAQRAKEMRNQEVPYNLRCHASVDGVPCKRRRTSIWLSQFGEVPVCDECKAIISDTPERVDIATS